MFPVAKAFHCKLLGDVITYYPTQYDINDLYWCCCAVLDCVLAGGASRQSTPRLWPPAPRSKQTNQITFQFEFIEFKLHCKLICQCVNYDPQGNHEPRQPAAKEIEIELYSKLIARARRHVPMSKLWSSRPSWAKAACCKGNWNWIVFHAHRPSKQANRKSLN